MISKETFMRIAYQVATESKAEKRKVGAVIVKDNNIIALGYNGTPSGFSNICEDKIPTGYVTDAGCALQIPELELKTKPEVLHAESNAISKCARSTLSSEGADIYTTTSPCLECAKLIIQSGIKNVFYSEEYSNTNGIKLLERANIKVEQVIVKLERFIVKIKNPMTDKEREEFVSKWKAIQSETGMLFLPNIDNPLDLEYNHDS